MAENNLSPDSNSIKSDEVYLSETEKDITISDSIYETLEDNKTSNETSVSNVSQENLSWKGNEKIHKIADKEQKLSDFMNSLKSTEHPIQGHESKPCFLESLPENVQQCKERKCEMSQSLESNVEKTCTTGTEESTIDTDQEKNENDSVSKSLKSIEPPPQEHGNDACYLEPVPEKAQMNEENEFEMLKSIELNVDKICTAGADEQTIETDQEKKENDSESKLLESTEHPTQIHVNDTCFLEPVPENAQMNEENEFEMSKSLEINVDKICTNGTETSIIDTGKNENDSGSKSVERTEPLPQDHGNDACFLEPVPENAQPCKGKEFETSKSIELNVDKICTAYEEESTIETDQKINENDSASKSPKSIELPTQEHGNDRCFLDTVPGKIQPCEEKIFEISKSVQLIVDKIYTACEEESTTGTDQERNEDDSASKSLESIEPPIQEHGNDARFFDPVPGMVMTCEDREFETSKSLEPSIDKTCIACEEEPAIETDQEKNEDDSASNNIKTSIERTGRSEDSQTNEKSNNVWNTQTENKNFIESGNLATTENEEEFEKSKNFKSVQTNYEVNNHLFRLKKTEQFIGDSCAANPFSVNTVQCNIRRPVRKIHLKREPNKATKSATYVLNETVYCTNHCLPVKYWCHQCNAAKCGMCVNVVYSRKCANHPVITMSEHVYERKKTQMAKIQESSKACLMELESNMSVLKQNEQITQFQELIQKERIRQEFVSLHELLIEEEMKILQKLGKSFEEYTLQNRSVERTFGSVVEEEARLMCKSLDHINKYDPYGQTLTTADIVLNTEWSQLGVKVHNVFESLKPIPRILQDRFTMQKIKVDLKAQFSTVLDPVEVHPIQFTLYLDDKDITTPFKVSDLFLCKNSLYSFTEIELEVEINCNKVSMMKEKIKLNDYILNIGDKPYLKENQRYIVKARACSGFNELRYVNQRVRNVLIVTGGQPISKTAEYLINTIGNARSKFAGSGRYNTFNKQYLKWKQSKLWLFSSVPGCDAFYDISPEELRAIAYSMTRDQYITCYTQLLHDFLENCNTADEDSLKLALSVVYTKNI